MIENIYFMCVNSNNYCSDDGTLTSTCTKQELFFLVKLRVELLRDFSSIIFIKAFFKKNIL